MKTFEVELRALLTEKQYNHLLNHFNGLAKGEKNDMETYAFLLKDKNIKVKNMVSKKKAKITFKDGAEYRQQTNEVELPIHPKDVKKAVSFIQALGYPHYVPSKQKRLDYKIGEITISLKNETHWKHHVEAEIIVNNKNDISKAKEKLHTFFKELHLSPMTEEETRQLTNSVLKKFNIERI